MAWRTTEPEVRGVVDSDSTISVEPFIKAANALTDHVSSKDTAGILTTALLAEIEKYLAAHFYAIRDPQYQAKRTERASAEFQGKTGMGLDLTHWGQQAKLLDVTGTLAALDKGKRAGVAWLGLPPSDQTDYMDRD